MLFHRKNVLSAVVMIGALSVSTVFAAATGNRYNLPRDYAGEISAASAYLITEEHDDEKEERHKRYGKDADVVIIDVRTVEEHVAGHPEDSFSIPYPHIQGRPFKQEPVYIGQDPQTFFEAVAAQFPDRGTPILTLCRTGKRSVLAANILANPKRWVPAYTDLDVEGYTNVRNIWEGFVGMPKTFTDPQTGENFPMDLNNDGVIGNADLDGWSNYQGLPVDKELDVEYLYQPYLDLYFQ